MDQFPGRDNREFIAIAQGIFFTEQAMSSIEQGLSL